VILSELRRYLKERGQATLTDIALHFDAEPDALRPMLEMWIRKGKVERWEAGTGCGSACQRCDPAATEIYRWSEGPPFPSIQPPGPCPR
jgi:putative ferrous iron transport protein C